MLDVLILIGGYSKRMQKDKAWLDYGHGIQYQFLFQLAKNHDKINNVFISGREEQIEYIEKEYQPFFITDQYFYYGPYNALLTAFKKNKNNALFLIGCDYPFLDHQLLTTIIDQRSESHKATLIQSSGFYETTLGIFEPFIYSDLLKQQKNRQSFNQSFLAHLDIKPLQLSAENKKKIQNVNTLEDYNKINPY